MYCHRWWHKKADLLENLQLFYFIFPGQGAGIAAAVGIRTNKDTHEVDIQQVQAELKKQGVKYV